MSTVFVARDNALGRIVVVKVLPYELAATVSVDRFKREIMLSAALQHPHIVPVLSAGETAPTMRVRRRCALPFFIMPFVEGESLRARLGARSALGPRGGEHPQGRRARARLRARARHHPPRHQARQHSAHRGGSATVTDFGVAKAISASRETRRPLHSGDGAARSRSSARRSARRRTWRPSRRPAIRATDHRADLYALGIVGYEMLVGTPPFHGRAPQQLLAAQLTEKPPPIGSRRYDVPAALATLIMQLLEKEPAKRPKTRGRSRARARGSRRRERNVRIGSRRAKRAAGPSACSGRSPAREFSRRSRRAARGSRIDRRRDAPAHERRRAAPASPAKSIAVMPLVNISRDTSDAYFAAGMTADLTNALSRIPGLRVATGNESARARPGGEPDRYRQVARREHGAHRDGAARQDAPARDGASREHRRRIHRLVGHVRARVEGRVQGAGRDLDARSSPRSRRSCRAPARAGSSARAAGAGGVGRIARRTARPISRRTISTSAAASSSTSAARRAFAARSTTSSRRRKSDSNFARAYAGIANVYALLPLYANVRVDSVMPLAMSAINRAIALDSTLAEAFASRATLLQASWRWADAERDYKRALALDPNSRAAHQWYGELLLLNGRSAEAQIAAQARHASSIRCRRSRFGSYALALAVGAPAGRRDRRGRRAVELDSTLLVTRFMLGTVYLAGEPLPRRHRASWRPPRALDSTSMQTIGLFGYAYAKSGKRGRRTEHRQVARDVDRQRAGAAAAAARVYLGLGRQRPRAHASRARGRGSRFVLLQ